MSRGTVDWCRTVPFIRLHVYSVNNQSWHAIFGYNTDETLYFDNPSIYYDESKCIYDNQSRFCNISSKY